MVSLFQLEMVFLDLIITANIIMEPFQCTLHVFSQFLQQSHFTNEKAWTKSCNFIQGRTTT